MGATQISAEPWSVEDRLARAREELRRRWPGHPALRWQEAKDGRRAEPLVAEVDSFLSSRNSDRVADAYAPFLGVAVDVRPLSEVGRVQLSLAAPPQTTSMLELDGVVVGRGCEATAELRLEPGTQRHTVRARGRGYAGSLNVVTLTWDRQRAWPDGLAVEGPTAEAVPDPVLPEAADHPEIRDIADRLGAANAVRGARCDLDTAIAIRRWVKSLWHHEVPRRSPPYNGRLILERAQQGVDTFICMHYAVAFVHACASVGLAGRVVNLHRHVVAGSRYMVGKEAAHDPPIDEHVTAECYLPDVGRWVMMDPDFDCHYERAGRPLSAWEIHETVLAGHVDELDVRRGPGAAAYESLGPDFYETVLPTYYRHVSLLSRSDFISDPDGPVPVLHLVDAQTPPILWHDGEDLRLQPHLMGPLVVGRLHDRRTHVLTDGSLEAAWASSDEPVVHRATVRFPQPRDVNAVGLSWPEHRGVFMTSRAYEVAGYTPDGGRVVLAVVDAQTERPSSWHAVTPRRLVGVEVVQSPGGGCVAHPDRLWLAQIEVFDGTADSPAT